MHTNYDIADSQCSPLIWFAVCLIMKNNLVFIGTQTFMDDPLIWTEEPIVFPSGTLVKKENIIQLLKKR